MTTVHERRGALEAIDRILNRGGDAGAVVSDVTSVLARLFPYVRVEPVGVEAAPAAADETTRYAVTFGGATVASLAVVGAEDAEERQLLERVAVLIGPYC